MAVAVVHAKVSAIADGADSSLVRPSDWNADHTVTGLGTLATQDGTFSGTSSGTNTGDQTISDATISTTDITTNDATTAKHGFMPKGTGSTTTFFRSDMTQAAPSNAPSSFLRTFALMGA